MHTADHIRSTEELRFTQHTVGYNRVVYSFCGGHSSEGAPALPLEGEARRKDPASASVYVFLRLAGGSAAADASWAVSSLPLALQPATPLPRRSSIGLSNFIHEPLLDDVAFTRSR